MNRLTGETLAVLEGSGSGVPATYADTFAYDLNSNRTEEDINGGDGVTGGSSIRYQYNPDDQLASETETTNGSSTPVYQTTYTYDADGNLATETRTGSGAETDSYAYDLRNRMTASTGNGTTTTYTYAYDVRNKLATVATNGTTQATYVYDDAGNRVQEAAGGVTTFYLNDDANPTGYAQPLEEKQGSPTATPTRTYLIGTRVFGQADAAGAVSYLLTDAHGSTQQITDGSGTITAAMRYATFGTAINFNPGSSATEYLFGGDAVYDPVSGLYLHGDGVRGVLGFEFIQADTQGNGSNSDPLSLHKYLYASGNPIDGFDPSGHDDLAELTLTEGLGEDLDANVDEGDVKAAEKATGKLKR